MTIYFDASDINNIVLTKTQSEIAKECKLTTIIIKYNLSPNLEEYWSDKLSAYQLALDISIWLGNDIVTSNELLQLKVKYLNLLDKYTNILTARSSVKGGIPI